MTKGEIKQARARMKEINRAINSISRMAQFMTEAQLKPYEAMADEYDELKRRIAESATKAQDNPSTAG